MALSWGKLASSLKVSTEITLTQGFPYQIELIHVRFPRPQRRSGQQLSKDAADRPDIDWGAILCVPHQQLRRAVPPGGHVVCVVVTWSSWRVKEGGNRLVEGRNTN